MHSAPTDSEELAGAKEEICFLSRALSRSVALTFQDPTGPVPYLLDQLCGVLARNRSPSALLNPLERPVVALPEQQPSGTAGASPVARM